MKITNKYKLPLSLVDAVSNDNYTKGNANISVTSLWKSPRIMVLEEQYADLLERDVVDSLWSILGKGVHAILCDLDKDPEAITEKRLYTEILGWTVSGQFDRYLPSSGTLQDYKVTSAWSMLNDSKKEDWENQLNTYAHLLRNINCDVNKIEVIVVLRDWSQTEALRNQNYPQQPIASIPIQLWTPSEALEKITARVKLQQEAKKILPLCTEKDQWAQPAKWAIMKTGGKRAVKLYESHAEALFHLSASNDPKLSIVERKGMKMRCERYCAVKNFCDQYRTESSDATDDLE
jgi:hypothetical protein